MNKEIIAVLIFNIILFFIVTGLEKAADAGLKKTKYSEYCVWNDINSSVNADLLIQGSSRAWCQVSPKILDSIMKINSYNLGMSGYNFDMEYCRFKVYLEHNVVPKYIVQIYIHLIKDRIYMHDISLYPI